MTRRLATKAALLLGLLALAHLFSLQPRAQAATVPAGFSDSVYASGLTAPTAMDFAPDGRLFVAEQGGKLRVIHNGALLATPFVTLSVSASGERGLLGVAFDPDFATNQYVYAYYTATSPAVHNRVSRFTANGNVAVAGSETIVLELDNLSGATNHNGGAIHFGADGKLYVATGDNANGANSQTLTNLLGKLLRINKDGTIPTDNPFYGSASGNNRAIWALGLRNPFTFSVQPGTGRIVINDVGQSAWEEINDGIAGSNYGWPNVEGQGTPSPPVTLGAYRDPLYAYGHGSGCAITGGVFYNPPVAQFPAPYSGRYFFADYCNNWIRTYTPGSGAVESFLSGADGPVDQKVGADGSLYYLNINNGTVGRVQHVTGAPPTITQHPSSQTKSGGQPVTFTVSASGTPPLSYQWQRNGTNITGATSSAYTIASVERADNGAVFRAIVTNPHGSATSNGATLTVTPNAPPAGAITSPAAGTLYAGGQTISYAGSGSDPEDGTLPPSAFTWEVVFHHDTHTHPFIPPLSGVKSGSFDIPNIGHTETNVWYRVHLTVTDSDGLSHKTTRDIRPRVVNLSLATKPVGLKVTLDGQPVTTPATVQSVVGVRRTLGFIAPQTKDGASFAFAAWSDGGAAVHEIVTPDAATSYTATYRRAIVFDDLPGENVPLSGQDVTGLVDWGPKRWFLSGPWGNFPTKSVGFNGPGPTSAAFSFVAPRRLLGVEAYNGGAVISNVVLRCAGQTDIAVAVRAGETRSIGTDWTAGCVDVTIQSSNGWNTNFDNFLIDVVVKGDADGDGAVLMADALAAAKCALNVIVCSSIDEEAADVDCDGSVRIVDAMLIARRVIDLSFAFPC